MSYIKLRLAGGFSEAPLESLCMFIYVNVSQWGYILCHLGTGTLAGPVFCRTSMAQPYKFRIQLKVIALA